MTGGGWRVAGGGLKIYMKINYYNKILLLITLKTAGSRLRRNPCEDNHCYSVFSVDFTHYYGSGFDKGRK